MPRTQKPSTVARHLRVLLSQIRESESISASQKNAVRSAIAAMPELYAKDPGPFRWALPEAFVGECGCYYPARRSEAKKLVSAGLAERTECTLDYVPIFEPLDGITPSQVEQALRDLRKDRG
jgi:hypothetical protein